MKTLTKIICSIIFCLSTMFFTTSCGEPSYVVEKRDFYYSLDNGATYGKERYELEVGKTVLMKIIIKVSASGNFEETSLSGTLYIPKIDAVDAYYLRGQKITPNEDYLNNVTSYPFNITANEEWTFIFEFIPNEASLVRMELDFDEPIPDLYDVINSIKFVKKEETTAPTDPTTEGSTTSSISESV